MINTESSKDQFALSEAGAEGYMQLMPKGGGKGLENVFDAKDNIDRGTAELAKLCRYYRNTFDALRAYNWGEGNYNNYLAGLNKKNAYRNTKLYEKKFLITIKILLVMS